MVRNLIRKAIDGDRNPCVRHCEDRLAVIEPAGVHVRVPDHEPALRINAVPIDRETLTELQLPVYGRERATMRAAAAAARSDPARTTQRRPQYHRWARID